LSGFKGDAGFARNDAAQKTFSKLRSAIAGIYAWRAEHAGTPEEKARMTKEADFAFRQAFALCPRSPETVFRQVSLLMSQHRVADARMVAQTLLDFDPKNGSARDLVGRLQETK
jgi:cytochrome c-type biogenesis protein CcmH/NrfG